MAIGITLDVPAPYAGDYLNWSYDADSKRIYVPWDQDYAEVELVEGNNACPYIPTNLSVEVSGVSDCVDVGPTSYDGKTWHTTAVGVANLIMSQPWVLSYDGIVGGKLQWSASFSQPSCTPPNCTSYLSVKMNGSFWDYSRTTSIAIVLTIDSSGLMAVRVQAIHANGFGYVSSDMITQYVYATAAMGEYCYERSNLICSYTCGNSSPWGYAGWQAISGGNITVTEETVE